MAGEKAKRRKRKTTQHVSAQELHAYFQRALSENRQCQIEEHLARCRRCARLATKIGTLLALIEDWGAKTRSKLRLPTKARRGKQ